MRKKIILYSLFFTFLLMGYGPVKDIVKITVEEGKFDFTPASSETNYTEEHWPITGWQTKKLSTAAKVKYLSDLEKDVILHLNMARSNPAKYAQDFILPRVKYYRGKTYREPWEPSNFRGYLKKEGVEAIHECVGVMEETLPGPLLHPSKGITLAARDHAIDKALNRDIGHFGSDGSNPSMRLERYGEWRKVMGESISYGPVSGREIVVNLLVDDGILDRKHRDNILNSKFNVVGVSIQKHPVYEYICVIDFAGAYEEDKHQLQHP